LDHSGSALLSVPEIAQGSESIFDEVIVTLQKREEGLQDIAITSLNGSKIC
jgi:hypothetical protein